MPLLRKIASGTLIGFGIFLMLSGIYATQNLERSPQERSEQAWACLLFGVPFIGWGAGLRRGGQEQKQQQEQERLRSVFFQTLKQTSRLTPLQFAMAANIPGAAAKAFLDDRAREFVANFDVDEQGDIYYRFNTGRHQTSDTANADSLEIASAPLQAPPGFDADRSASQFAIDAFDIVLVSVPATNKIAALKLIRQSTGLGLREAKNLIGSLPKTLKQGVSKAEVEARQRRFEAIGAVTRIVPHRADFNG